MDKEEILNIINNKGDMNDDEIKEINVVFAEMNEAMEKDLTKLRKGMERDLKIQKIINYLMIALLITGIISLVIQVVLSILKAKNG